MPSVPIPSARLRLALLGLLTVTALALAAPVASADHWDGKWYKIQTQYFNPMSSPYPQVVTNWEGENEQSRLTYFGDYANQKWAFVHVSGAPGWFKAVNGWSGKCLSVEWWDATPKRRVTQQRCAQNSATAGGQLWHQEAQPGRPGTGHLGVKNKNGLWLSIDNQNGGCPYFCTDRGLIVDGNGQSWDMFSLITLN